MAEVFGNAGLDHLGAVGGQRGERAFLVLINQPRVTCYVGSEYGSEAALDALPAIGPSQTRGWVGILCVGGSCVY